MRNGVDTSFSHFIITDSKISGNNRQKVLSRNDKM